ncbi:hypothetical protein N7474_007233 [Penicillium riverlandense]|uniref:uncharacterized protein n=1 Tax=Penicillium riverlandense TaxID=1903569 RepID=UPI002548BD36|nr:uncharacterized protein N7474_007233 [Penicillium riverlandense]KAJ5815456.1 hypothetical protein N7474_007233 [Penicillium riverlandense]
MMDATSFANMIADPREDDYMLSAKTPTQFPKEIPQMLESNNFPSMGYSDRDDFARYIAPLDDEFGMQLEGGDNNLDWTTISNHILHQPPSHPVSDLDEEIESLLFQDIATRRQANSDARRSHSLSSAPTNSVQESSARISRSKNGSTIRNPRRQNHSCDQCRSSKKACNLPLPVGISGQKPSTPCATCNARGLECTVAWISSKRSEKQTRKKARTSPGSHALNATDLSIVAEEHQRIDDTLSRSGSLSTLEGDLARQLTARETCLQQFNLYVDVCDMPLSQCLLQGSMPPRYSLGIAALAPLSNSVHLNTYLEKTNMWMESCWELNSSSWSLTAVAPHTFRTVSLLDSLFQEKCTEHFRPSPSRDASINESYKWTAIATAAQYAVHKSQRPGGGHSHDLALATCYKAQKMVFKNIAASGSFRQSLSLILFGLILRPKGDLDDDTIDEDSRFALCEGIRRLHSLCTRAHDYVREMQEDNPMQDERGLSTLVEKFPSDVTANVLELIGAISWLTDMMNSTIIAASHGEISPMDLANCGRHADIPQIPLFSPPSPRNNTLPVTEKENQLIDDSILSRAISSEQTLMTLRRYDISDARLEYTVRQSGSLVILLWKSLASLTLAEKAVRTGKVDYEKLHWSYGTTMKLVKLWRTTFGTFDGPTTAFLEQSSSEIRHMVAFCLNDGDLAVLLFHETTKQLEMSLSQLPSTPERERLRAVLQFDRSVRQEQRLMSAAQVSTMASIRHGVSGPGFQGVSGLKACVQDIWPHPYPTLVVQAHTLSAKALAEQVPVRVNEMDMKGASEMSTGLETCLQALRGLQETLVVFPDVSCYNSQIVV